MFRWPGRWWPSAITTAGSVADYFVKAPYLARTRHAHQVTAEALHILQQGAFLSYVQFEADHAVSSEQ